MAETYKPGNEVPHSGIYAVTHDPVHIERHEVTCIEGRRFPPCRGCQHPSFALVRAAQHIEDHESFKQQRPSRAG